MIKIERFRTEDGEEWDTEYEAKAWESRLKLASIIGLSCPRYGGDYVDETIIKVILEKRFEIIQFLESVEELC